VEAGAELDQRRDAPVDDDAALGWPGDAGHAFEQRALAGSIAADHAVGAAFRHRERHAAQRLEGFVRLQIAQQAAVEDRRLERSELLLLGVPPVHLRHVDYFNRGRHTGNATTKITQAKSRRTIFAGFLKNVIRALRGLSLRGFRGRISNLFRE
jgi:hypothetical protein